MAKYTFEVREIVENNYPIFDFNYTFFDPTKKAKFEQDFIRHFYFREIGCDTIERFKWYLEDKMNVVFPYYNELLKTATIEYDKLNNYIMEEKYTIKRENNADTKGTIANVGTSHDEQTATNTEDKTSNGTSSTSSIETDTKTHSDSKTGSNSNTIDNTTANTKGGTNETTYGKKNVTSLTGETTNTSTVTGDKTNDTDVSSTGKVVKKFLDTPQGNVDLTSSSYLTNMGDDSTTGSQTTGVVEHTSEHTTGSTTETGSNTSQDSGKDTTTNSETNTTTIDETQSGSLTENTSGSSSNTIDADSSTTETTTDKVTGTQTNIADNRNANTTETKQQNVGNEKENYEGVRKGSIGVATPMDFLQKHIELQKTLSSIQKMFFDECEDLFMMVY